tara:strand:+ start:1192 stop:1482 length:291 start_codon:yes stop_codon:yes gene_type:complete
MAIAGILVILYWMFYLQKSKTSNYYYKSHIVAELITGIILIYSSITKSTILIPIALGMLLYATVNIIGDYIDKKDSKMIGILLINIIILLIFINNL